MDTEEHIVLLVGKNVSCVSCLAEWFAGVGMRISHDRLLPGSLHPLETRRFDVVLSETELADGNAYGLISTVTASPTNLFFCLAAEDSYWWLPAVTQGGES